VFLLHPLKTLKAPNNLPFVGFRLSNIKVEHQQWDIEQASVPEISAEKNKENKSRNYNLERRDGKVCTGYLKLTSAKYRKT
jgi:hypothetical protein